MHSFLSRRERKRVQMIQLAARTRALEQENANLQFMLGLRDQEIGKLRTNLASLPRGAREGEPPRTNIAAAASPSEPAVLTGTATALIRPPPSAPPCALDAYGPAPQPASLLVLSGSPPGAPLVLTQSPAQPGDDRIQPEQGAVSLPGTELGLALSFQGSSEASAAIREQLQLHGAPLLIDGLPIEIDERGNSTNMPGIIVGSDGQWLRLKQRSASSPYTSQPPQPPAPTH